MTFFPIIAGHRPADAMPCAALSAAREAYARAARLSPALRFGIALHARKVIYGNVGTADRLDCIGTRFRCRAGRALRSLDPSLECSDHRHIGLQGHLPAAGSRKAKRQPRRSHGLRMRLTSDFWVQAHIRRVMASDAFAGLTKRGATEAGAIFIVVDRLNGEHDLYGPAIQSEVTDDALTDRLFECLLSAAPREDALTRLDREKRFDPDLWVIEIEDRLGRCFLDLVSDAGGASARAVRA